MLKFIYTFRQSNKTEDVSDDNIIIEVTDHTYSNAENEQVNKENIPQTSQKTLATTLLPTKRFHQLTFKQKSLSQTKNDKIHAELKKMQDETLNSLNKINRNVERIADSLEQFLEIFGSNRRQ